jgi:hypothetical protein
MTNETEKQPDIKLVEPEKEQAAKPEKKPEKKPEADPLAIDDAADMAELYLDPALGDELTGTVISKIPIGKPKDFFRVHSDPGYRRLVEIYTHKPEGQIDEQHFFMGKAMRGVLEEARMALLVTCIYRDGSVRLWPLKRPKSTEKDNDAWVSARTAARAALTQWVRLVWVRNQYEFREAQPGYAPEPDWSKLPAFNQLMKLAVGPNGVMRDVNHPIYRDLTGAAPKPTLKVVGGDDDDDDLDVPFAEIWCIDTEFYPGSGLNNGGVEGDPLTPLCLVALELRTGRLIRLWQHELGLFPPYRLDPDALIVGYMLAAEFGFHVARGWGEPACALDAYVEFRHYVNDGTVKTGERDKGSFYGLGGALRYFCEDAVDLVRKTEMRDRILQGPPFSEQEQRGILYYCEDDVRALARLLPHIAPTIRSLPQAMWRAKNQWPMACQERRGIPVDGPKLAQVRQHWQGMRTDLVIKLDQPFGCYEIDGDGIAHFREQKFADYVRRHRMSWPTLESGDLDTKDQTFREMAGKYPHIEPLRELRYSMSKLKLNDLAVGNDARNRTPLWAFGTKTARCAPSNSKYIFGPAKWLRFLITPPPERVLVHRDYKQQEPRIAAIESGDTALLEACESEDLYLGIAQQLGFLRESMSDVECKGVRQLFKTVVLGIQYGLGARSLAMRAGISVSEAAEILARLRARFHVFEDYTRSVLDHAGLKLELGTPFGWYMRCPSGTNPRTIRNFPIQSTGSEILHVLCILAERRSIGLVAPIHDAVLAEGDLAQAEDLSRELDRLMGDAAAVVLRGYRLPTDSQIVRPGERYFDERGKEMWDTVADLLAKREQGAA